MLQLCSNLDMIKLCFLQFSDGTTTVVLLAGEFLKEAKSCIEDGIHPHSLILRYRTAGHLVSTLTSFHFFVHLCIECLNNFYI